MTRLLIRGGTLACPRRGLERADVSIEQGRIEAVARSIRSGDEELDASGCVVLAGLVDAHTHSSQLLLPSLRDDLSLPEWMLLNVYLAPGLSPDDAYLAAAVTAGLSLSTGTVALLDHGPALGWKTSLDAIEAVMTAIGDIGIRASVAPTIADRYLWETLPSEQRPDDVDLKRLDLEGLPASRVQLTQAECALERWGHASGRTRVLLGPSTPERASCELIEGLGTLERRFRVGAHLHLFESRVQRCNAHADTAIKRLGKAGLLGPRSSIAHGVWLTDRELGELARLGVTLVHNPVSNLRTGAGVARLDAIQAHGIPIAMGSDGALIGQSLDMCEVAKIAALVQRSCGRLRGVPTAADVIRWCQWGGARALGLSPPELRPGARADLVIVRTDHIVGVNSDQLWHELVYGGISRNVRDVIVDGQVVVRDGVPVLSGWRELLGTAMARREQAVPDAERRWDASRAVADRLHAVHEAAYAREWSPVTGLLR